MSGLAAKAAKWPIYKTVPGLASADGERLGKARVQLNLANIAQAVAYVAAAGVFAVPFVA